MKIEIVRPTNFTLILYEMGSQRKRLLERLETRSQRRFTTRVKLMPQRFDTYLRVYYSNKFWNDGNYFKRDDLFLAYYAFIEK